MRKLPARLAAFFILITILRVANFAVYGLKIGTLGYAFAVGLAIGVYASAYFVRFKETRVAAVFGLILFGAGDLWFNEFELMRSLSTEQLLPPDANFLHFTNESLIKGMQITAVIYGAFPTIAAIVLGYMQSGAEKVGSLKVRQWFGRFGIKIQAIFESFFPETSDKGGSVTTTTQQLPGNNGNGNEYGIAVRWETLTARQKEEIAGMSTRAIIAAYAVKSRTARNWKKWSVEGK